MKDCLGLKILNNVTERIKMIKFDVDFYKEYLGEKYTGIFSTRDVKNSRSWEDAKEIKSNEFDTLDNFFQFVYDQHSCKDFSVEDNDHIFKSHIWCNSEDCGLPYRFQTFLYDTISIEEIDELFYGEFHFYRSMCARPNNQWTCGFKNIGNPSLSDYKKPWGDTIEEVKTKFIKELSKNADCKYRKTSLTKCFRANDKLWYTYIDFKKTYFST